jgi:regulator of RNase E activity RraA
MENIFAMVSIIVYFPGESNMKDNEREQLLTLYADLRICDVRDGMDAMGYFHYGSLDSSIRPLWRTLAFGIAKTVRYLPYRGSVPQMSAREYREEWTPMYYEKICPYPWTDEIEEGDFIVIDLSGLNVGLIGSCNGLGIFADGARGFVINGGVRDTDELIREHVPVWSKSIGQTMVQVRLQYDAHNIPIAVGGVQVRSGDIVVADGDGVIVVPQEIARDVARWAHDEHDRDKKDRREQYLKAGLEFDGTL